MANPYMGLLEQQEQERQHTLSAGIAASSTLTQGVDPDAAAQARATAQFLQIPPAAVEAMPREAEQQARIRKIDQDTAAAPVLRQRYTDQDFMKLASDDSGALASIEQAVRSFTGTYVGASAKAGVQDLLGVGAKLVDKLNPFTTSAEEAAVLFRNDPAGLQRFNQSAAGFLPRFTDAMSQASDETMRGVNPQAQKDYGGLEYATTDPSKAAYLSPVRVVGDALRSLPTSAAMALSIVLTRGAAAKAETDALAAGATPIVARQAGVDAAVQTMARYSAGSEGAVGYAQQANQSVAQLQGLADEKMAQSPEYQQLLTQGYAPEAARQLVTQQTSEQAGVLAGIVDAAVNHVGGAVLGRLIGEGGKLLPRMARGAATEAATEFVQSGGEQVGQNMAVQRNVDPKQSLSDGVLENMIQGLLVGGLSGAAFSGFGGVRHAEVAAQAAEPQAQALQQIMQLAAASKVRQREAATFEGFMQQATEDGPLEQVFVNPKEAQAAGIDLTQLAQVAPSVAPQLAQALETGTDIGIPTSELATRLPGTPLEQQLLQHIKTDPGGFSQASAQAYFQTQGEELRQSVEKVMAERQGDETFKASIKAVEDNVRQQLTAANRFTDDVNNPYAAMWANFFGVQAARLGVTPEELFNRYQPKIVAQTEATSLLDQEVPLRQGGQSLKDNPNFAKWFGDSKAIDAQGEPLMVYHGSPDARFVDEDGVFATMKDRMLKFGNTPQSRQAADLERGFFFTTSRRVAQTYADPKRAFDYQAAEPAVIPAHLAITNPLEFDAQGKHWREAQQQISKEDFIAAAKKAGHDGVVIRNVRDSHDSLKTGKDPLSDVWVAFDSHQIKSADRNRGTFDPKDPNILHQQATQVQQEVDRWKKALSRMDGKDMDYAPSLPTPTVLRAVGLKDATLSLPSRAALKIGQTHPDVPLSVVQNLPQLLSDPLYAFPHRDGGWNVAIDATTEKGEPIVVGVRDGRVRTITPYNDSDGFTGAERLAHNWAAAEGRVYARNEEAPVKTGASAGGPDRTIPVEAGSRSKRTVITRAALVKRNGEDFYQGDEASVTRGMFDPATNTVALLKAADLSTFLHESGHFFLEVMADLATQANAPQAIREDFDAFLRWTGVEGAPAAEDERLTPEDKAALRAAAWAAMTLDEKRAHHEDFARGFEAYLFEGTAPSIEVQGLFQRFRAWLLNVYRDVSALNIHLNDEIRGVFDRMLATTEQIKTAEDVRGYEALFKNRPQGMTEDEWAVYQLQAGEATQDAIQELQARTLRDMRWLANAKGRELARLQKEAKARRTEVEGEVRAEVEAMPVYQAMAAIREQRQSDPADRQAVKDWQAQRAAEGTRLAEVVKGEYLATAEGQASKGIERGQFLARNKRKMANEVERLVLHWEQNNPRPKLNIPEADLQAVADLHGFSSADELRKAIEDAQPIKDVIEGMTDQRMLERYGDLADPGAMERAAEEAIHNNARLRFVATEANALQKAVGKPALLAKAVRQFAADIVARTRVRDLRPSIYTAAERRAAQDAAKAMRESRLEDAAVQKRNQLINAHAAKAAMAAQDEAQKAVEYLRGFNRESLYKSLDADYIDQIHQLLERFDLRAQSLTAIDKRASLADWLKSQEEAGLEPDIPPELANEARRTSYKNLTMEELRGLRDTVKQIEHLGRLKHKLLTAKDQRDYEAIRDSIVASIVEHAGDKHADNRTRPTALNSAIRLFTGYVLEHRKVASLVRELDGFKDGGVFWEYLVRSMNEAGDHEATMRADAADKLAQLVKPMLEGGKRGGKGQFFPTIGKSLNREERLGIAMNMGNAGNIQRLLDGEHWTLPQLKPVLDTFTAADWHFVQGVWDFLETYRPLIAAKERRIYGKEPNWIEAQPLRVETADGQVLQLRGGYFPIKYDTAQSGRAEAHADAETAKQMMRGAYTSATTRRSFTKARAEEVTGRPLMYSTDALFNGVNEIIHDLSWHEWLIDANRLLRSKSIDTAVRSRYGAEVVRQLKSAVRDIAAGEFPGTHAFERGFGRLRAGTVAAGMGLNVLNAVINVQGITQSMVRIGTKWTGVGLMKFAAGPIALSREVAAKSEMMANRAKTLNREVNEIQSLVRDKSRARQAADRILFLPLTVTQQLVDLPTWWGAYQKALDGGEQDARAVALADQAVLDAQSGGQVKDLAAIQRGGPLLKLWTTFYGFFNSTYNLTVESTKATDFHDPMQVVRLATNYMLLWVLPALLGTLLKNLLTGGDWDEDKMAKRAIGDQISYMMGMMVGLRDVAGAMQAATGTNEFNTGYGGPAGARFLGELYKVAQQVHQGEADAPLLKAVNNIAGMLFHYPATQVNRSVEGAKALYEGRTSNPLALVAGPPPKQ